MPKNMRREKKNLFDVLSRAFDDLSKGDMGTFRMRFGSAKTNFPKFRKPIKRLEKDIMEFR